MIDCSNHCLPGAATPLVRLVNLRSFFTSKPIFLVVKRWNPSLNVFLALFCGQLEEIDHGANAHVETLARLDLVKTHMGDCLHTLTEAASWNALVREVNAR